MLIRNYPFFFVLFTSILLFSCGNSFDKSKESIIEGKLNNSNGEWIYLKELDLKTVNSIDSVKLNSDGTFYLQFENKNKSGFYLLSVNNSNDPITLLIEVGEKVKIEGSAVNLKESYLVKNSPGSTLLKNLGSLIDKSLNKADSLYFSYRNTTLEGEEKQAFRILTDSLLRQNQINHYESIKDFCRKNKSSMASIFGLYSRYGDQLVLDFTLDFPLFQEVSFALAKQYKNNIHVDDLVKRVNEVAEQKEREKKLEALYNVGNYFPDIELQDKDNMLRKLTELKGKNVLIYVWEASDKNCWDINLKLKDVYKKYAQQKNFEIFAISLDSDKMQWVSALNVDKYNWVNVIGVQDTKIKLGVKTIPRFFLLDTSGKIIEKDFDLLRLNELLNTL